MSDSDRVIELYTKTHVRSVTSAFLYVFVLSPDIGILGENADGAAEKAESNPTKKIYI